jgi:hypothetical protein
MYHSSVQNATMEIDKPVIPHAMSSKATLKPDNQPSPPRFQFLRIRGILGPDLSEGA